MRSCFFRGDKVNQAANRFEVIQKQISGLLSVKEASLFLKVSERHFLRLKALSLGTGVMALIDGRAGSHHKRISESEKLKILGFKRDLYPQYNVKHFQYVLKRKHDIERSYEFLRKLLKENCLYYPKHKRRKKKRQRKRFEARAAGLLIQRDASIHRWLKFQDKPLKLILDIDDHSRKITGALFSYHDDVLSNMMVSLETIETHGLPAAYYTDNNPIYNPIRRLPKQFGYHRYRDSENKESLPQFKRAIKELGIEVIHSKPYEPQGKGKVERVFRFMQDRLVEEMATAGIKDIRGANAFLRKWVDWYNHSHVHRSTGVTPNERYLAKNEFRDYVGIKALEDILCIKQTRIVNSDHTFSYEGTVYQLRPKDKCLVLSRKRIELRICLNYELKIYYNGEYIQSFVYKPSKNKNLAHIGDIFT